MIQTKQGLNQFSKSSQIEFDLDLCYLEHYVNLRKLGPNTPNHGSGNTESESKPPTSYFTWGHKQELRPSEED